MTDRAGIGRVIEEIEARPTRFDLFQALRRLEADHPALPRFGEALRPGEEPVRFAGDAALDFAPAPITRLERQGRPVPKLIQRVIGFFGPNGALPIHLTEYARERAHHHGDRGFAAFADLFLHRFGLLFYRAWAKARPVVSLDRPEQASAARHVGGFIGIGTPALQQRDALGDYAKLFFAGRLSRSVRDADGLASWVRLHFGVPCRVEQFCGHWMPLHAEERTRLGLGAQLAKGATLGRSVWDVQHKFRLVVGPLDWDQFVDFQPQGEHLDALLAMVRQYVGFEFAWELQRELRDEQVPEWPLGHDSRRGAARGIGQLGRSAWLRGRQFAKPSPINVESISRATG